ncbi:MAG TPA: YCF48-related protein [Streptosporangiaceae bacterium]|nr:YCF48-related protein [Streptosporangiaceae bacterium]
MPTAPAAAAGCGAQEGQQALAGGPALTDVQFVSPGQGWVAGRSQILGTTDGGQTWSVQRSGDLDLSSVDFVSGTSGWAVGGQTLLGTTNGRTWTVLPEPCPVVRSVHFVSAETGYAVAGGSTVIDHGQLAPQSGGELLVTGDGGSSWHRLAAPANPQSVCFSTPSDGWLGAAGGLYRTTDGGTSWTMTTAGPGRGVAGYPFTMIVACAGDSAWGLDVGSGAAMSQEPHIGYYADPAQAYPIFAEQYFPHPGISVTTSSPGAYVGAMSAISPGTAAAVDWCPACGWGTAPWDLLTGSGRQLMSSGTVGGLTEPSGVAFLTPSLGWVVGVLTSAHGSTARIVRTQDGGHTWQVQYSEG